MVITAFLVTLVTSIMISFVEGNEKVSTIEDYHSHNTARLDVEDEGAAYALALHSEDLGLIDRASREIRSE